MLIIMILVMNTMLVMITIRLTVAITTLFINRDNNGIYSLPAKKYVFINYLMSLLDFFSVNTEFFKMFILQFFKPVKVSPKDYGKFYKGDSYIILQVSQQSL